MLDIQTTDPAWYQLLVSPLTEEHKKELEEVFRLADQKKAAAGEQSNRYLFIVLFCLHCVYCCDIVIVWNVTKIFLRDREQYC